MYASDAMSAEKYTSIRVKKSTAQRLNGIGRKGESYDDLIVWLLENSKKRKTSTKVDESKETEAPRALN